MQTRRPLVAGVMTSCEVQLSPASRCLMPGPGRRVSPGWARTGPAAVPWSRWSVRGHSVRILAASFSLVAVVHGSATHLLIRPHNAGPLPEPRWQKPVAPPVEDLPERVHPPMSLIPSTWPGPHR